MIRVVLFLVLVALTTTTFAASDFYISPAGNDTQDCSNSDTPCLTLNGTLAQISGDDDIKIYFNAGNYTGPLNVGLVLPVQEFSLLMNETQNGTVVFDCESKQGTTGISLGYQTDIENFEFINCETGIYFDAVWTGDDEDTLTLNNVDLTGCNTGLNLASGSLDATDLNVLNCPTGVSILDARTTSIVDSTFSGCSGASIRVSTVNETTFSLDNSVFTNTAGFTLNAVCSDSDTACQVQNCTFAGLYPADAKDVLFELDDGYWNFDDVNITKAVSCGTAFNTIGQGNITFLVLIDSTIDDSCVIAVNHTADGPLQVRNSQIATQNFGLLISAVDTILVENTNFTNCATNAISATISTDRIDLSELQFENTGPIAFTIDGECAGGLVDSTLMNTRVVIAGGEWGFKEVTFNRTQGTTQYGGFLQLAHNGNTSAGFEIDTCTFEGGFATNGGAVYAQGNVNISIHDSTFTSNTATNGAAVYLSGVLEASMKDDEFSLNTASKGNGTIYLYTDKTLDLYVESLTFTNNTADNGAVIFCCNGTCQGNITVSLDSSDTLDYTDGGNVNLVGDQYITCTQVDASYETAFAISSSDFQVTPIDSSSDNGWFFWLILILLVVLIVGIVVAAIVGFYFYRKRMSYSRVD